MLGKDVPILDFNLAQLSIHDESVLIDTGAAFLYVLGTTATDDVVFGEPGDLTLLGARSLEGLNLRIDPVSRRLIDAGPAPAAVAA